MTHEDAVKWLGNLKNDIGNPHYECLWPYAQAIDEICELLKKQEPVVQCKDCTHFNDSRCLNDNVHYSIDDCGCKPAFYVADDWFCAEGERR
jgi:hypothetical protein